jgi:5-methylcytosine-specific restriction endonuclease McrA
MHKAELRRQVVKNGEKVKVNDLVARDGFDCQICFDVIDWAKRRERRWWASLDHIVPIKKGGLHTTENCRMVHIGCNSRKGARLEVYAKAEDWGRAR